MLIRSALGATDNRRIQEMLRANNVGAVAAATSRKISIGAVQRAA